jgi:hypothetical protein
MIEIEILLTFCASEISKKKKCTDGLKIVRSQELLPVSLETRVHMAAARSREFD